MKLKIVFLLVLLAGAFAILNTLSNRASEEPKTLAASRSSQPSRTRRGEAKLSIKKTKDVATVLKQLTPTEIERLLMKDEKEKNLVEAVFPDGKLIKEEKLGAAEIVRYFKTRDGEEIIRIYSAEGLTSENWLQKMGTRLNRSLAAGRMFAFSYQNGQEAWTNFYDASGGITKKIILRGEKKSCVKYDLSAPVFVNDGDCLDDDFREYEDLED
jgi:predicted outer membrane lipoprotein